MDNVMAEFYYLYPSPLGELLIISSDSGLKQIQFDPENSGQQSPSGHPLINLVRQQLDEYFAGSRTHFDLPLEAEGSAFQNAVWQETLHITYGQTATYSAIAQKIGRSNAFRAVGLALGKNPIPIVIPCHRVIGSGGQLTGYGGGLWRKEWLLKHEKALLHQLHQTH